MDVNILTKNFQGFRRLSWIVFIPVLSMVSCRRETEEGEIVIRAEDFATENSFFIEDTLSQQTVSPDSADSVEVLSESIDSLVAAPDTLAADSSFTTGSDSVSCPWRRIAFEISGSIYASLRDKVDNPDILGAHIVRCMWWNTDPWRGMSAGDSLYVLIGETGRENQVIALRYVPREGTSNGSFSVYNFKMTGDNYPSHYYSDGTEVMKLLNYMPINTFEEMTGPYGEPRGNHTHTGVDFKAPEGTPARTCRGGTVTRLNWNYDYNGNCVEIEIGGGYREIFLHLHEIAAGIHEGTVLAKGDIIGYVGSTGVTSTASHIHYQINDENGNSIDPYLFYSSHRRSLPQEDMPDFIEFRDSCDRWLKKIPER